MKEIIAGKKFVILVDDDQFRSQSRLTWGITPNGYARRNERRDGKIVKIYMHREIAGTPKGLRTDHINCNKLDNRKSNLRFSDASQNGFNSRLRKNNTLGFKGVRPSGSRWQAQITVNWKAKVIGTFKTIKLAAEAYDRAAVEARGEFALTNKSLGLL